MKTIGTLADYISSSIETHGHARGTFPEDKLRLTGFAGLPPRRFGTHSPTGAPVELCGALEGNKSG